ncbi:oxysterol-binding protein 1-like isoform X2 [Gigantopelta aegis]|uniref:oxysterol-binding protein 1-like isoform X2 n=1 Tax=Gigantopelta aegis TaxID=1735272 RepID=UPI001B889221|nr:oxysterol-binding protein 1-like isoform X2 [Gigantopelta aegis]
MSDIVKHHQSQYRGWIYKWTNYLKGYQKRWFVLQNGLLSYYRNQAEMAHTCRGTINLANAFISTEDSCTFIISNGGAQVFYLKATSEVERQKWVTALELAKAEAIRMLEAESDDEESHQPDKFELQNTLRTLSAKLEDLNTCNDLIAKHGHSLQKTLTELEQLTDPTDITNKLKAVNERATIFRITTNAMINACAEYKDFTQTHGKRWQKVLQFEHDQRMKLEEMVEQLAKDQASLENKARKSLHNTKPDKSGSDEEDFFDALDHHVQEEFEVVLPHDPPLRHRRTDSDFSIDSANYNEDDMSSESEQEESDKARVYTSSKTGSPQKLKYEKSGHRRTCSYDKGKNRTTMPETNTVECVHSEGAALTQSKKIRRKRIPDRPNFSLNLWSIMKTCIGKELSKIPMPVNFNEPLSMLQRLTEELEYSHLLDNAGQCQDSAEQLTWVAAFTISAYAPTTSRTGKPFNPLLGETYEFDRRDDLGWRTLAEQVSHHPPTLATHSEGKDWTLSQEFTMTSKFRGKYLQIIPLGIAHLIFHKSGNHYTWRKVTTTVHNIIVGRLWVDSHGEMDIVNHQNGDKCHLKYAAYSYFSREIPRKVTGVVTDAQGTPKWVLTGTWDAQMECAQVLHIDESNKGKPVFETGPHKLLWKCNKPLPDYEKIYHFTQLSCELNEPEDGVAPTDSRNRPDQRFMENGQWDEANRTKVLLEEKQRAARRKREQEMETAKAEGRDLPLYQPMWFKKERDPITGNLIYRSTGEYWDCKVKKDWSRCPDIFL